MEAEDILRHHLGLCEETYDYLQEENTYLKEGQEPPQDFYDDKEDLLADLEESLGQIKLINPIYANLGAHTNEIIDQAQKRLMQIFLLDRDNERMMKQQQTTEQPNTISSTRPLLANRLSNIYNQG